MTNERGVGAQRRLARKIVGDIYISHVKPGA